jgi:hypothetical protein
MPLLILIGGSLRFGGTNVPSTLKDQPLAYLFSQDRKIEKQSRRKSVYGFQITSNA